MSRIKIILADSNYSHLEHLQREWHNELDFDIHCLVTTGGSLLKHVENSKPDVVVMDLTLKEMDGFTVLEKLQTNPDRPVIVVYSSILDAPILNHCAGFGVDYYVKKPTEATYLARRIRMLCQGKSKAGSTVFARSTYAIESRTKVTNLLNKIGMPNKLSGYRYLRRALLMVLEDKSMLEDLNSRLYAAVADEEKTIATNVERSIRYAIEFVFMYGCLDVLQELFGFTINSNKGKPSNREFLAMLVDHMTIS